MTQPPAAPTTSAGPDEPSLDRTAGEGPTWRRRVRAVAGWQYLAVVAATCAFAAMCLGFLLVTPTLVSPDELYHFDRVMAAEHGHVVLAPTAINVSAGARGVEHTYVVSYMRRGSKSWAEFAPHPRGERPSFDALGGDSRSSTRDVTNYETQHPPLFYGLMGGLVRLWPGADSMAGDKLVLLIRSFNVLLMLPLPLLFYASARRLLDNDAIAKSAAFLPLFVPGLARVAATINNDNLAILFGAIIVWLSVRVMRGDNSLRTAVLVSATCVGASLTKGTILFALWIVAAAYVLQWIRARSLPSLRLFATLVAGAIATAAWWVHNYVAYGTLQPDGWGSQFARAQGTPRGNIPIDMHHFYNTLYLAVASRFWGALGLHEPPKLPHDMLMALTIALAVCCLAAVIACRGRRWDLLVLIAVPISAQLMVLLQAYLHYRHYLAIPGIQGRYVYPTVFGVLVPFAIVLVLLMRRAARWAPLVMCGLGVLISGWGLYVSAEYTWLHRGERLVPGNWSRAYHTMSAFYPLPPAVTAALTLLVLLLAAAGVAVTMAAVATTRRQPVAQPAAQPAAVAGPARRG